MKTIYQVQYSDYDDKRVYGTFSVPELAQELCSEVNEYFKQNQEDKEAYVLPIQVYDENDKIYRCGAFLNIINKDITVENIEPTYQPRTHGMVDWPNLELVKERLEKGFPLRAIIKYGTTPEEAKQSAMEFYNILEKEGLIKPIIDIIIKKDKER